MNRKKSILNLSYSKERLMQKDRYVGSRVPLPAFPGRNAQEVFIQWACCSLIVKSRKAFDKKYQRPFPSDMLTFLVKVTPL
jgi:hypothetical protein